MLLQFTVLCSITSLDPHVLAVVRGLHCNAMSCGMQAFAIAAHACHVHLGTQLGQAEGQQAAALPCFRSAQPPTLPVNNSIPLPQVEVSYTTPATSVHRVTCTGLADGSCTTHYICVFLQITMGALHVAPRWAGGMPSLHRMETAVESTTIS